MNPEIKHALLRVMPFAVILIVLFLASKRGKINTLEIGLQKPSNYIQFLYWVIGFFILVVGAEFVFYQLGILEIEKWKHPFYPSMIRIIGAVIFAPIAEEIIFRGLLLYKLSSRLKSFHIAIFLQAILFVLLHNFAYENTVSSTIGIVQSLIDASLFGYARHYTKSLYTPIVMHMSGNFVAVFERFIF